MAPKQFKHLSIAIAAGLALSAGTGCAESPDQQASTIASSEHALGAKKAGNKCKNPEAAILATLTCVENEDAGCAAAGYAPGFVKLHNTIDTHTVISGPEFWAGAFFLLDLGLDIDHVAQVGPNEVSIRYVETVTTILGEVFYQHEHALVTVDDECKMTLWDQYGDNAEQKAVDDAVARILSSFPPSP